MSLHEIMPCDCGHSRHSHSFNMTPGYEWSEYMHKSCNDCASGVICLDEPDFVEIRGYE